MSSPQSQAYGALLGKIGGGIKDYYGNVVKPAMSMLRSPGEALVPGANAYANAHPEMMTNLAVGMVSPGAEVAPEGVHPVESAEAMFERMFNRENEGEYTKAKELAQWETGHEQGVQSPEHRAQVTQEWNKGMSGMHGLARDAGLSYKGAMEGKGGERIHTFDDPTRPGDQINVRESELPSENAHKYLQQRMAEKRGQSMGGGKTLEQLRQEVLGRIGK